MQGQTWGNSLPPVHLLHGTEDNCAPVSNATQFADALSEAGCRVRSRLCRLHPVCRCLLLAAGWHPGAAALCVCGLRACEGMLCAWCLALSALFLLVSSCCL